MSLYDSTNSSVLLGTLDRILYLSPSFRGSLAWRKHEMHSLGSRSLGAISSPASPPHAPG
ncbi:MAG: hypothetical protein GSR86_02405 [Desulfurococcales archaeon]|nr:hypothetical protein [Desulfurococcales archaeon]